MSEYRIERDSMGELKVPANALYGAQTQRAVQNFKISGLAMPREFIRAVGLIKSACAAANAELGVVAQALLQEVLDRLHVVVRFGLERLHALPVLRRKIVAERRQALPGRGPERRDLGDALRVRQRREPRELDAHAAADEAELGKDGAQRRALLRVATV